MWPTELAVDFLRRFWPPQKAAVLASQNWWGRGYGGRWFSARERKRWMPVQEIRNSLKA